MYHIANCNLPLQRSLMTYLIIPIIVFNKVPCFSSPNSNPQIIILGVLSISLYASVIQYALLNVIEVGRYIGFMLSICPISHSLPVARIMSNL